MSDSDKLLRSVGHFSEVEIRGLLLLLLLFFLRIEARNLIHNLSIFRLRPNTKTNDSALSQDYLCFHLELLTPLPHPHTPTLSHPHTPTSYPRHKWQAYDQGFENWVTGGYGTLKMGKLGPSQQFDTFERGTS